MAHVHVRGRRSAGIGAAHDHTARAPSEPDHPVRRDDPGDDERAGVVPLPVAVSSGRGVPVHGDLHLPGPRFDHRAGDGT